MAAKIEFTSSVDFGNGETLVFNPSRPSKQEAILIGQAYFEAADNDRKLDKMLDDLGPVLIRRSLRAFANYAARTNQKAVAKFAFELRDDIVVVRGAESEDEDEAEVG